jgi:hypothetical protein
VKIHVPITSVVEKAAQDGLRKGGRQILKRARELSPTDEGGSDKSGFVRVDDLTLQVGFTSHISRMQHENLDYQHENGEQAKFLEAAVEQIDLGPIIAASIRKSFE